MLGVDGCGTTPTYTYTNQTNIGSIFSSDGEKGDGTILCACELGGDTSTPFKIDREVVERVIADATSGGDQAGRLAFASSALAAAMFSLLF